MKLYWYKLHNPFQPVTHIFFSKLILINIVTRTLFSNYQVCINTLCRMENYRIMDMLQTKAFDTYISVSGSLYFTRLSVKGSSKFYHDVFLNIYQLKRKFLKWMILKYTLLDSYQYEFLTEFSIFIPSVPDHLSPLRFRLYKRFRPKIPEKNVIIVNQSNIFWLVDVTHNKAVFDSWPVPRV